MSRSEASLARTRITSVDLLRGLVLVVMVLDHVRDYFSNVPYDGTSLTHITVPMFFTRWITHFCAPIFVFIAGTGMFLAVLAGKSKKYIAKFLITRGLWLIFLEITVINIAWTFNFNFTAIELQVIWAIGCSMIVLAGMIFLPDWLILSVGAFMVIGHNALDGIVIKELTHLGFVWNFLHVPHALIKLPMGLQIISDYPLIPWIGVMQLGYVFGRIFTYEQSKRRLHCLIIGAALLVLFVLVRLTNLYGDPALWSVQSTATLTLLSFLNCAKYPPSFLYLALTLGGAICLLPFLENLRGKIADFFITIGRVPLFFYILHIYLIHVLAIIIARFSYQHIGWLFSNGLLEFYVANIAPKNYGFGLIMVYLLWFAIVLMLFPLCKWYANIKSRYRHIKILAYL